MWRFWPTILIVFFSTLSFAEIIEVHQLERGTCWVYESEEKGIQLVNFGRGKASVLNENNVYTLYQGLQEFFAKKGFELDEGKWQSSIHCSSSGLSLVLHHQGAIQFCAWFDANNSFSTIHIGPTNSNQASCYGSQMGRLEVVVDNEEAFLESLDGEYKEDIISRRKLGKKTYFLGLHERFHFRENEMIERFQELVDNGVISKVKLVDYNVIGGQFHQITLF
jgi:hypothetical protein